MLGTFFAGYLFDILGRKITLFSAFIVGSVLVLTIPYTAPSVFPSLLIVRMLITTTLSAPNSNPLLADYIHKDAIGKAAALIGLGYVVGEVIAMAILFPVTKKMNEYNAFLTVAIVGAACSIFFIFLVKEPQLR
jgi:MFS family permease